MIIFEKINECRTFLLDQAKLGKSLGFVPTMGALHRGHLALIKASKTMNDLTICSIFVNPIQFNNPEDLRNYPRNLEEDTRKLEEAGCDLLFAPSVKEMYPEPDTRTYTFGFLDKVQEGAHRPGHFNGVATVVRKLLEIIEPGRAYFGEKDYQQLLIIKELVRILGLPVEIIACPTLREADGLAMSSRNLRLSPVERENAPVIYQTLKEVRERIVSWKIQELKQWAVEQIESQKVLKVEYFEIADAGNLQAVEEIENKRSVIATVAAFAGKVRLIDNLVLIS